MTAHETVYLVDDDPAVLKALARALRAVGLHSAPFNSAEALLQQLDPHAPGCLVLDLSMPGSNGIQLQETLAARRSTLPVIFLTGRADVPTAVRAMKLGAVEFLTKPVDHERLLDAIRRALEQDRSARREHAAISSIRQRLDTLTPREREVMIHVVAGRLNKQVAAELGAAEKTIKVHRARVMEKMGAESLADLVRIAQRAGVPPL